MKKIRKKYWIIIGLTVIILISLIIGGKIYMDNQAAKQQAEEWKQYLVYQKDGANRIKKTFSDVAEIKFTNASEGAPGTLFLSADLTTFNGQKVKIVFISPQKEGDDGTLGGYDGGGNNDIFELPEGKTITPVKVIYQISKDKTETEIID